MLPASLLHHFKLLLCKPRILDLIFISYIHRSWTFSDPISLKCGICSKFCNSSGVQHTHMHIYTHTHPYTAYISFYTREDSKNKTNKATEKGIGSIFYMITKMVRNDQIVVFMLRYRSYARYT